MACRVGVDSRLTDRFNRLTKASFGLSQSLERPWQVHPRPSPVNTLQWYLCSSDPIAHHNQRSSIMRDRSVWRSPMIRFNVDLEDGSAALANGGFLRGILVLP